MIPTILFSIPLHKSLRFICTLLFCLLLPLTFYAQDSTPAQINGIPADTSGIGLSNSMLDPKPYFFDGLKALQQNQLEAALEYFSMAHTLVPRQAGINYAMADTYLRMGDLTSAAYHAKEATKADSENKWYWAKLAQIYRSSAQFDDALEALSKAITIDPSDEGLFQAKITLLQSLNRTDEALAELDRLIEQQGVNRSLLLLKLSIVEDAGQIEPMILTLKALLEFEPADTDLKRALSQAYISNKQYEEAIILFQELIENRPSDTGTRLLLIEALYRNEEAERALDEFQRLWNEKESEETSRVRITQFLMMLDQELNSTETNDALQVTTDWITNSSTSNPQVLAMAIDHYLKQGNNKEAIPLLKKLVDERPENEMAWRQYLQLLYSENRFEEVVIEGTEADLNVPDDPYITFFVGSSLQLEGQSEKAFEWLSRSAAIPSDRTFRSIVYGSLGDVHAAKDQWEMAYGAYEKALEYNSENDNVLNNYAYYLSESDGDLEKAAEMARKANRLQTGVASYLDTLGWIYYLQGKHEEAKDWILKAIDTGDASATVKEHLGDIFNALNDSKNAKKWWNEAYKMDSDRSYLLERIEHE